MLPVGFLRLRRAGATLSCSGFSPCRAQALGTRASVVEARGLITFGSPALKCGLVVVEHGLSCSSVCGIFLDQGLNPCSLHWQVNSYPLYHQGSLRLRLMIFKKVERQ